MDWNLIYDFLTGPVLWFAFIFFLGGFLGRITILFRLSRKKDRVIYDHFNFSWGLRSILHWIIPWASASMRQQPFFTLVGFLFHLPLLVVPIFLDAHIVLWDEAFGITLWSLPDGLADAMTVVLMTAAVFLIARRLIRPEVRILNSSWDYVLLIITVLPFITGFLAYHQWGPSYELMLNLHILLGEILLILIPFTKLGHMLLFFFTRASIGFEMGGRRGARTW